MGKIISRTRGLATVAAGVLLVALFSGCASDFGIKREGVENWIAEHQHTALGGNGLSVVTQGYLERVGKVEEYRKHPAALLKLLHDRAWKSRNRKLVAVLIELCYDQAEKTSDKELATAYYMSTAVYAYTYLFDKRFDKKPSPYEPEFLYAVRFYNYATTEIFRYLIANGLVTSRNFSIPYLTGEVVFEAPKNNLPFDLSHFEEFKICYEYSPYGFHTHTRQSGLGVPFVGVGDTGKRKHKGEIFDIGDVVYPGTLMMRFKPYGENGFKVVPEYVDPLKSDVLEVDGQKIPVEVDISTYLGFILNEGAQISPLLSMMNPKRMASSEGLYLLTPYDKDKIPVVFVHGLMSYPRAWVQMINTLLSDPIVREKYQFWLFAYPTANPILYSAAKLRRVLKEARASFDPAKNNRNFERMVIVGHSMGGLLTKMMVQNTGNVFLRKILGVSSLDELDLNQKQEHFVREMAMFKPLPFVTEVVFINTPHRGSTVTRWTIAVLAAKLIGLPRKLVREVVGLNKKLLVAAKLRKDTSPVYVATGVDNLDPDNRTIRIVAAIPIDKKVVYHSIIGNNEHAGIAGGTDGIVPYDSAHLDGAASELVIHSGHSGQKNPDAIMEVERILREHLKR